MSDAAELLFLIFVASVAAGAGLWLGFMSAISWEKMTVAGLKWVFVQLKSWRTR